LVKYSSKTAVNTEGILTEIKALNNATSTKRQEDLQELIPRFSIPGYEDPINYTPESHPGTCEWFVRHHGYATWLESRENNLLLATVAPGCGKSVLARFLIKTNLPRYQNDSVIVYFFFKEAPSKQEASERAPNSSYTAH
jgi:hypothetical protein